MDKETKQFFTIFKSEVKGQFDELKIEFKELRGDFAVMQGDISYLREDVSILKTDVKDIKEVVHRLDRRTDEDIRATMKDVVKIKSYLVKKGHQI